MGVSISGDVKTALLGTAIAFAPWVLFVLVSFFWERTDR
jgi:hypothetical protein